MSQTLIYRSDQEIYDDEVFVDMGTLAFSLDSERMFLRSSDGWRLMTAAGKKAVLQFSGTRGTTNKQEASVQFRSKRKIHLVALNEPHSGNMKGIDGADSMCKRQAAAAKFHKPGNFHALLYTSKRELETLVVESDHDSPLVNLRGQLIYKTYDELLEKQPAYNVPILAFNDKDVFENKETWARHIFWHGSEGDACENWTSDEPQELAFASALENGAFLGGKEYSCSTKNIVLCIEQMNERSVARRVRRRIAKRN